MLINHLISSIKIVAIAFLLISLEFIMDTYIISNFNVEIYIVFIIPYISLIAINDRENSNYLKNFIIVSIIAYIYTLFFSIGLIFTELTFVILLYMTYEIHFKNSKIRMYLFSNAVFIIFFVYRILYFIFFYNVAINFTNMIAVNLIIPTFINSLIMYLFIYLKLNKKEDFSKLRRRFYV